MTADTTARLALILTLSVAVSSPPLRSDTAAAARRPLAKVFEKIEAKGPDFEMHTDAASGNVIIRYDEGKGKWRRAVYVPPNQLAVTVEAAVGDLPDHVLRYSYRLASAASSKQRAVTFIVEVGGPILAVTSAARWESSALAWKSAIHWASDAGGARGLAPGASTGGFAFQAASVPGTRRLQAPSAGSGYGYARSPGALPGIVKCYLQGDAPVPSFPSEPPESVEQSMPRILEDGLAGRTVGPVEIPATEPLPKLAAAMNGYVQASLDLGWIDRRETADRYAAGLAEIRRALGGGALPLLAGRPAPLAGRAAAAPLRALAAQVAADQKSGSITSEAYALLAVNARYLLAAVEAPQ